MSLRGEPISELATVAGGARVTVRVGVPEDPYMKSRDMDLVDVEVHAGDQLLVAVTTAFSPDQTSEARRLAREIVLGLESGRLELSAGKVEEFVFAEH